MQTATNPQTGEKVQWNGSAWAPLTGAPQTGQSGVQVVGNPRPAKPKVQEVGGSLGIVGDDGSFKPTYTPPEKPKEPKTPEQAASEQKAAGFARRAIGAYLNYRNINAGARSLVGQTLKDRAPNVLGALPDKAGNSTDRRLSDQAELEFLSAALRQDSGATIPPEEIQSQRPTWFPSPGDTDPKVLANFDSARVREIEGLIAAAGDAVNPDLQAQIDAWRASINAPAEIPNDQLRSELAAKIKAGERPAAIIQWLVDNKQPITDDTIAAITANQGNQNPQISHPDPNVEALKAGVGDVVEGVGDTLGLIANPLNAGVNAIAGTNLSTDLGQTFRDASGLPQGDPLASAINKGGAAALTGSLVARGGSQVAGGAVQNALAQFGGAPLADTAAGAAAGGSAEGARQLGAPPIVQGAAALLGGAATVPMSMRVARSFQPVAQNALLGAGNAEGVSVNRAMIDPGSTQKVTAVGKTMVGGAKMQSDMRRVGDEIKSGVIDLAQGGTPLDDNVGGQTVARAATRSIENSGKRMKARYGAAERAAGDAKVPPTKSTAILDEMIGRLSETESLNSAEITFLKGLRSDFSKNLSVGALRDARTTLRKKISKGELTFGQNEARVLDIMEAAADDISTGLTAQGKGNAAALFKSADGEYRERAEFIKGTIQKLIGKRGANLPPGQVMANLRAMASPKGDNDGFAKMLREMDPDERSDIAATFADALGTRDGKFSTNALFKNVEKLPANVKHSLFGQEGAESLANLSRLAKEHDRVTKALGGSPTGVANDYRSWLYNLVFGGTVFAGSHDPLLSAGAAAAGIGAKSAKDYLSARSLMSKDVAGWLRNAPRTSDPKAINAHFARLKAIATRNPAISSDLQQLGQMIMRAANENAPAASRAAASDGADTERQ